MGELLDAAAGVGREGSAGRDDALRTLFAPAQPGLLAQRSAGYGAAQDRAHEVPRGSADPFHAPPAPPGQPRAYLTGYWAAVVGVLCKARPGPLMRFLDASPGVARGLVALLGEGVGVSAACAVLGLPWARPCALLDSPHMALARGEGAGEGLPSLLLGALGAGLAGAGGGGGGGGGGGDCEAAIRVAEGAAAVLAQLLAAARAGAPAAKFSDEGYNDRLRAAAAAAEAAARERVGAAEAAAAAAGGTPTLPSPQDVLARHAPAPPSQELRAALSVCNMALCPTFTTPAAAAAAAWTAARPAPRPLRPREWRRA